ncbi:MAG: hypothetical protein SV375_19130, partial [Thermodesulfobacteriota bacterium]|nr:hypothetical protein [Thermodesulfobacteriota bacterium]
FGKSDNSNFYLTGAYGIFHFTLISLYICWDIKDRYPPKASATAPDFRTDHPRQGTGPLKWPIFA